MDQFDLFDADLQGYKPLKAFAFLTSAALVIALAHRLGALLGWW